MLRKVNNDLNVKEKEILLRLIIIFIGPDCGYFDCNINFTKKKVNFVIKTVTSNSYDLGLKFSLFFYKYSLV